MLLWLLSDKSRLSLVRSLISKIKVFSENRGGTHCIMDFLRPDRTSQIYGTEKSCLNCLKNADTLFKAHCAQRMMTYHLKMCWKMKQMPHNKKGKMLKEGYYRTEIYLKVQESRIDGINYEHMNYTTKLHMPSKQLRILLFAKISAYNLLLSWWRM